MAHAKRLACERPWVNGVPLARYSLSDIRRRMGTRADGGSPPSVSRICRWFKQDALKPWRHQSWLFPRDPYFLERAGRALDLYEGFWEDAPLGPDEFVFSADEKTSIQALGRPHPTEAPGPGRPIRVEQHYARNGVVHYLAALDVRSGRVAGRVVDKTGAEPFLDFVDSVMEREPYRSASRVFWIVDNGSCHHPSTFPARLKARWPQAVAVRLPVHASWLNQVEIYFSIVERKALTPNDLPSPAAVRERLAGFETYYNADARPFQWHFTKTKLKERLRRLDEVLGKRDAPEGGGPPPDGLSGGEGKGAPSAGCKDSGGPDGGLAGTREGGAHGSPGRARAPRAPPCAASGSPPRGVASRGARDAPRQFRWRHRRSSHPPLGSMGDRTSAKDL